jgi:REP element-mobilizing transposase RayT
MEKLELLQPGKFYHIFNCGINSEDLFREKKDYERFLRLYEKYIFPVCDTYAWVLMKNHFHIMVRVKENITYKYSMNDVGFDREKFNALKWETVELDEFKPDSVEDLSGLKSELTCQGPTKEDLTAIKPRAHLHLSHFCNAYAKYINIKYKRHGSLFERPFKRKEIDNIRYFQNVIIYIHQNPVHHGFCDHILDYGWTSYQTCISLKPTSLKRDTVMGWFNDEANFILKHNKILNKKAFEEYLDI